MVRRYGRNTPAKRIWIAHYKNRVININQENSQRSYNLFIKYSAELHCSASIHMVWHFPGKVVRRKARVISKVNKFDMVFSGEFGQLPIHQFNLILIEMAAVTDVGWQ